MPYSPLHALLPEVARAETRALHRFEAGLDGPRTTFSFAEFFCDEPGCDCRRVFILAHKDGEREPRATISWGWEPDQFYRDWAGFPLDDDDLEELRGPALVRLHEQSEDAPSILADFRILLADEAYAARIIRHYEQFREIVDSRATATEVRPEGNRAERRKHVRRRTLSRTRRR